MQSERKNRLLYILGIMIILLGIGIGTIPFLIKENNKMIEKEKDGKWGYTDREGNLKVDYPYDQVTELNEYGFAGIKLRNKWGVINQEGQVVQEPIYEIEEEIPEFLGKYYRVLSLISQPYYTDYHEEETVEE